MEKSKDIVKIENFKYNPHTLKINKGDTVTWINKDSVQHTVTSDDGQWDSGQLSQGDTFNHQFNKNGTFKYHCDDHSWMHGVIIVGKKSNKQQVESYSSESDPEEEYEEGGTKTVEEYCKTFEDAGLKCVAPEINAVETDLDLISQHLEYAIAEPNHPTYANGKSFAEMKRDGVLNLKIMHEWFGDVIMYLNLYNSKDLKPLINYVKKVQDYIPDNIIAPAKNVTSPEELKVFIDF